MATIEIRKNPFEPVVKTIETRWNVHDRVYYIDDYGDIADMIVQEVHLEIKSFRDEQGYKIFGPDGEAMVGMFEVCKVSVYGDITNKPEYVTKPACELYATPEEAYTAYAEKRLQEYHKKHNKK